jgi:phosphoribosylamine--glycine ligase
MITKKGPMVLEFNVRFGDPEKQAILPRLKTDLVDIVLACIDGDLSKLQVEWDERACLCVVVASKGYPGSYEKHKEISGLKDEKQGLIFHAGTTSENGKIFTSGGRVLGVTGLGKDIASAKDSAYKTLSKIKFDGIYYRKDIGYKAIGR